MSKDKTQTSFSKEMVKFRKGIDITVEELANMQTSGQLCGLPELLKALWNADYQGEEGRARCGTLFMFRDTKNGDNTTIAIRLRFKGPGI